MEKKQLKRTFNGTSYYCEYAGNYTGAMIKKQAAKNAGFKVRVIKTKKEYQIFVS